MNQTLQQWIDQVVKGLSPAAAKRVRTELEAHYQDALETHMAAGLDKTSAAQAALADLGDAGETGASMRLTHNGNRYFALAAVVGLLFLFMQVIIFWRLLPWGDTGYMLTMNVSILLGGGFIIAMLQPLARYHYQDQKMTPWVKLALLGVILLGGAPLLNLLLNGQSTATQVLRPIFATAAPASQITLDLAAALGLALFGLSMTILGELIHRQSLRLYGMGRLLGYVQVFAGVLIILFALGVIFFLPYVTIIINPLIILGYVLIAGILVLTYFRASQGNRRMHTA